MLEIDGIKPEVRKMFKNRFPEIVLRLPFIDKSHLELTTNKHGEKTLYYSKEGKKYSFYHEMGVLQEATIWKNSLSIDSLNGLFVYGLGLGYYYFAIKEWLKEKPTNYLIFIEDDIAVFYYFLQMPWAEELLKSDQIDFIFFEDEETFLEKVSHITWKYLGGVVEVSGLQSYLRHKEPTYLLLREPIISESISITSLVKEVVGIQGVPFYINFFENLLRISNTHFGKDLFKKFKGRPAIVCGAGPSLNKNVELLKSVGNRALIFAGGSALNVLSRYNLNPHLGGGIDPTFSEYKRFLNHTCFEVPIVVGSRLCFLAMDLIHGFRLFFVGNEGGYSIQRWFEDYYQLQEELKWSGFSVMTFITQIVIEMGCDPIIFVGTDLATSDMQKYAKGVLKNNQVERSDLDFDTNTWLGGIKTKDINGKSVYTQWKWQMESKWISNFSKKHSNTTFINATEGGIGFKDVSNIPLKEVLEKYCQKEFDYRNYVYLNCIEAKEIDIPKTRIVSFIENLRVSLNRCEGFLKKIKQSEKIHLYHEVGEKSLKTFIKEQETMLESIELTTPGTPEFLKKVEDFNRIKEHLEKMIELSNSTLSEMYQIESEGEETLSVDAYWEKVKNELGYRYYLCDLDQLLFIRGHAMKVHFQSLENLSKLEALESQEKLYEIELQRIDQLIQGIHALLKVIEKTETSVETLWSDAIFCENGAYIEHIQPS